MIFENGQNIIHYLLGFFISPIAQFILKVVNPSLSLQNGDMDKLPIIIDEEQKPIVEQLVQQSILISKIDWDNCEISWDFMRHPLLTQNADNINANKLKTIYQELCHFTYSQFFQLKSNEEEINRIFIKIYDLQDELIADVDNKNVTIRKANLGHDIRSFISYAVGCMFGRYSLDVDGLVYAGGQWDDSKYSTFIPDEDNILPITDEEYFEDDIVGLFVAFVKKV